MTRPIADEIFSRLYYRQLKGIDALTEKQWDEQKHSRQGKGSDKGGEFAPKAGGSVSFVAPAIDDPSGSIEKDTDKAVKQLDSARHANQKKLFQDVDEQLGIVSEHINAVGVWSDGAENSVMIESSGVDHETLKYATAIKAKLARQKDAIAFTEDEEGNAFLYTVTVKDKNISELRKAASESGLQYHTIREDGKNCSKVIVFDPSGSGELDDEVDKFYDKVGAHEAERKRGQGEFLTNEYNSRSKASKKYDEIVSAYEVKFPDKRHYGTGTRVEPGDRRGSESTKGLTVGQVATAQALYTRTWDETKIVRRTKGDDHGGEFAPKGGASSSSAGKSSPASKKDAKQKPAKDDTGSKKPENPSSASGGGSKEDAAFEHLQALRKNLPRGFSLTDYDEEVRLPSGDLLQLNGNPRRAVQQLEAALSDMGHNPADIAQGVNSTERREARDAEQREQKPTEEKPEEEKPDENWDGTEELKKVGADFLDDIEPDENGSLIQARQSMAGYDVERTKPEDWHGVDDYTQNHIEEAWREDLRNQLENDSDFYDELRTQAETSADEEIDQLDNSEIAAEIHEELTGMNGYEDMTVDDVEEILSAGDDRSAEELRDAFVVSKRDSLIDAKLEGSFYSDAVNDAIGSYEDNMSSEDWFKYAEDNDLLGSEDDMGNEDVSNKLDELGIDPEDVTTLMGAPDDWQFQLEYDSEHDGVRATYDGSDGTTMIRVFHRNDDGDLAVYNEHFELGRKAPKGLGLAIFSQAVAASKAAGFVEFKTHAAGYYGAFGPDDYVGFAVWPTYGYTFPVDQMAQNTQDKVNAAYPDATDVQDIFDQPGGAAWWWKNGSSLYNYKRDDTGEPEYAHFDLTDDSRSMQALERYLGKKKQAREKIHAKMNKPE